MKKLALKITLFCIPFFLLAASYFIFDPFYVLHRYTKYGSNYLKTYNRNKVSTDEFLNLNPKYHFKSFIFGSSRSSAFKTYDWSKYIHDASPFHFDAFDENIAGILGKLTFIEKQGNPIQNVILLLDEDSFSEKNYESNNLLSKKDYRWSHESLINFHLDFFKSYFKNKYFVAYLDLKLFHTYRPYMQKLFKSENKFDYPLNDFSFPEYDSEIKKDSLKYYSKEVFTNRQLTFETEKPVLNEYYKNILQKIAQILVHMNTKYKIVIAPRFYQTQLHPSDLEFLKKTFGNNNVYDFSGKNKLTEPIWHFYEAFHFRPIVGKAILKQIYQ